MAKTRWAYGCYECLLTCNTQAWCPYCKVAMQPMKVQVPPSEVTEEPSTDPVPDTKGQPVVKARRSKKKPPPLMDQRKLELSLAQPFIERLRRDILRASKGDDQ